MVKGLTSPDPMQRDLMRTYSASPAQTFCKLRLPASLPFLFAGLKVAVAISLVGAIVGELPTGAQAGLGARLLAGSYYGQTIQIWAALVAAAVLASVLVAAVALAERLVDRRMGCARMSAAAPRRRADAARVRRLRARPRDRPPAGRRRAGRAGLLGRRRGALGRRRRGAERPRQPDAPAPCGAARRRPRGAGPVRRLPVLPLGGDRRRRRRARPC